VVDTEIVAGVTDDSTAGTVFAESMSPDKGNTNTGTITTITTMTAAAKAVTGDRYHDGSDRFVRDGPSGVGTVAVRTSSAVTVGRISSKYAA
jgi:hypothetical protein